MNKKLRICTVIIIASLLFILVNPAMVSAQGEGFQETFDGPTLEGWETHPDVTITEGALKLPPGSFALHLGDWSEITLTVKMKYSGEGEALINYYFRDRNTYSLRFTTGMLSLEKEKDGIPNQLGNSPTTTVQADTWMSIKITVSGGEHQVYINDELALTITDSEPLETGAILLHAIGNVTVEFDDLDVRGTPGEGTSPGEEAPPSGDAPQPGEESPPVEGDAPASPSDAETAPVAPSAPQSGTSTDNLIEEFFASQASTVSLTTFFINLILAAMCAYILGVVYIHWGSSLSNRRKFASNFMLMTVTTTFIILVVRSSVALSLGLVGALSIVRFRAAVKEPEELAYLFFAIGIGIGLGDNQRMVTLVALAAGIALIGLSRLMRRSDADVNLHLSVASHNPAAVSLDQITDTLRTHTVKLKLLRFDETAEMLEAAYMIEFRYMDQLSEAKAALRELSPSLEITFMDNKGIW